MLSEVGYASKIAEVIRSDPTDADLFIYIIPKLNLIINNATEKNILVYIDMDGYIILIVYSSHTTSWMVAIQLWIIKLILS